MLTSLLLRAGFSGNQGYPTTWELDSKIVKLKETEFSIDSSCTLRFIEEGENDPNKHSSYFLDKIFFILLVRFYDSTSKNSFDYENFYDFCRQHRGTSEATEELELFLKDFRCKYSTESDRSTLFSRAILILNQLIELFLVDKANERYYSTSINTSKPIFPGYTGLLNCLEQWGGKDTYIKP